MGRVRVSRYHDISAGHRVFGHEGACANLHGHNYRVHFECEGLTGDLDSVGRVLDFGAIKERLCGWLETHWDHRFLISHNDPLAKPLAELDPLVVVVPFNPTAEHMAWHLVSKVGPKVLAGTGVELVRCVVEETRKCSAIAEIP